MLLRLLILAGVALAVWATAWALRRYLANARTPERFDPADGGDFPGRGEAPLLVTFSGPYCIECEEVRPRLEAASSAHRVPLTVIDIKRHPELALKYDVRLTPTTLVVGRSGEVRDGWLGTPPDGAVEAALESALAGSYEAGLPPATAGRMETTWESFRAVSSPSRKRTSSSST